MLPERLAPIDDRVERLRTYRRLLHEAGLSGVNYPVAYGGRGYPDLYERLFVEVRNEFQPPEESGLAIGIGMCLPTIRDHGSDELRHRFIAPGLRGEELWCQLYSEPSAGSDLASLSTRAELDGDEWRVTGQKVWTSGAEIADVAILLARTDFDAPKHAGITMFVLDMRQPGVEVRPLVQMTGVAEFNEVFLDGACIPRGHVVGDVNGGWRLAVALMAHERAAIGSGIKSTAGRRSGRYPLSLDDLVDRARRQDRLSDPMIRQDLALVHSGERIIGWLNRRSAHPSITKLWRSRQGRLAAQTAHSLGGPRAQAWRTGADLDDWFAYHVLNCRGMSIGGGTDEIQRNTLGERVLGLPREPGPARDTPFRDLPRS